MRMDRQQDWLRWDKSSFPELFSMTHQSSEPVLDSANCRVPFDSHWAVMVFAFPNNENELKRRCEKLRCKKIGVKSRQ